MSTAIGTATDAPRRDAVHSVVAALRERGEAIRREELARLDGRWDRLGPDDRRRLEILTSSLVDALLREPTNRLRAEVRSAADIQSLRFLFALRDQDD
jgi:glutamyl-tRNA reductase